MRPQVAADLLQYYQVDLDVWLSEGRYGALLDLILQLPDPYSRFRAALNKDRELYEVIVGLPGEGGGEGDAGPAGLPYQQIGTLEHLVLNLQDRVETMISLQGAALSKKRPKRQKHMRRPITMGEVIQAEMDDAWADEFYEELGFGLDDE